MPIVREYLRCRICRRRKAADWLYELKHRICDPCARTFANLYHEAHTGAFLDWYQAAPKRDSKPLISHKKRWAIFKRDDYRCRQCNTKDFLTVDHIKPYSKGGDDSDENLQTLCQPCNSRKGTRYG